jgi:transcription-repair coupling factor (superfamily II helicase)
MFLKLMESAVAELKGETLAAPLDPEINISLSAFFSESYIPDIDQRMLIYRRLARVAELEDIGGLKAELLDRFGPLPPEAVNLLSKIAIKVMARNACVSRLDLKNQTLFLYFSENHLKDASGLVELIVASPQRYALSTDQILKARLTHGTIHRQLAQIKNILKEIAVRVNN